MKDIFKKSAEPLDLSEADSQIFSPYTLDLSPQKPAKKPVPRQTDFYEYMPGVMQGVRPIGRDEAKPHPDDEFGEKLAYWYESAVRSIQGYFMTVSGYVTTAVKPLRLYWAVVVGAGLILGLLIISYIATHRNWITSFPIGTQPKASGSVQGDKTQSPAASPGKGGAGGVQSAAPAAAVNGAGSGSAASGAGAGGGALPAVGGVPGNGNGGGTNYIAPSAGGGTTRIMQPAPAPAPLPVSKPAPTPLPVLQPVNQVIAPVKSLL